MKLSASKRSFNICKAEIRNMTVECQKLKGINLAQGVCDMRVPDPVIEGACAAFKSGLNTYSRHDGLDILREAISEKLRMHNNINVDPNSEIVVSSGSTGALYCALLALLDPGDEVIIFEPFYTYHLNTINAVGAVPRIVKLYPPEWKFDREELGKVLSRKTKGIIINTPNNPTGKVYSKDELYLIAEFVKNHNLFLFSDEIYEYFVYDSREHISPGSLDFAKENTITISGYSKTYSITGWRVGYCACQRKWAEIIGYVNDLIYVCAPTPLQYGVAMGIKKLDPAYYKKLRSDFEKKRNIIAKGLKDAGFSFIEPEGAYYILAESSHIPGSSSKEKAMELLRKTGVAAVPGSDFYLRNGGASLLRFCYAKEDEILYEACERLRRMNR